MVMKRKKIIGMCVDWNTLVVGVVVAVIRNIAEFLPPPASDNTSNVYVHY